jgi:hypothetical protein
MFCPAKAGVTEEDYYLSGKKCPKNTGDSMSYMCT